jgi:hypothetical protein
MPMLERWHNEDPSPLMQQWEALRDRGAPPITPVCQESLWQMRQELAEIERNKPQPPRNEVLIAARAEFRDVVHRYRAAHTDIVESQQKLRRYADNPIYQLLFDMAAVLKPPTPTQELLDAHFGGRQESADIYYLRLPHLETVDRYRVGTAWMSDRAFELENQRSAIAAAACFPGEEVNARTDRMVAALLKRINELERLAVRNAQLLSLKIDRIASQVDRVAATARYVRRNKRKGSK